MNNKIGDWLEITGGKFWPFDPRPEDIRLNSIAIGLSRTFRYGGHTGLSVAEHSVLISHAVSPENALWGLLHDASEGLGLPDIPGPVKRQFPDYKLMEERVMKAVAERFGLKWPIPEEVKEMDRRIVFNEKAVLLDPKIEWEYRGQPIPGVSIRLWSSDTAQKEFTERYYGLTGRYS